MRQCSITFFSGGLQNLFHINNLYYILGSYILSRNASIIAAVKLPLSSSYGKSCGVNHRASANSSYSRIMGVSYSTVAKKPVANE